jgi:UDP-GlcNAc:undecaprenyl-phosphate/decaprenyl-phosphate GlcNAc-1-phosphate transferase
MTLLLPGISFAICLILTPFVRQIALKKGWMARPAEDRWHKKPTALFGGIAIYLAVAVPLFVISDFSAARLLLADPMKNTGHFSFAPFLCIGMTLMFLLGFLDDVIRLKPQSKLLGQILVASLIAFLGFRLQWVTSLTIDTMMTIFWIVGITNAFNLLDNMDGLCAGTGMIAAVFLAVILSGTSPEYALSAAILAGASAAFLVYNFNPASIFMGDCGSLMIGFGISLLSLGLSGMRTGNFMSSIAVPVMISMVPILDTTMVTLVRLLSGRKASTGGKDHTSHRLVLMGFSEKKAVLFLYGVGLVSGTAALVVSRSDTFTSPSVIIPVILSMLLMGIYLSQLRVYPEKEFSVLRGRTFTPILVELTYKKQIVLVLLDFCLVAFSYYLSYRLRFDAFQFSYYFKVFLKSLPAVIACKLTAFFLVGVYRSIWGYLSTNDVAVYLKASTLASVLSILAVTFVYRFEDFSKGIFIVDWFITTGAVLGTRGFFRLTGDAMKRKALSGEQILIYGAGRGGEILLREILNNKRLKIKPIGFIDDDPLKTGKKLQGYSVLGTFDNLGALVQQNTVTSLLISFRENNPERMKTIRAFCMQNNIGLKQFSIHVETVDLDEP